MSAGKSGQSQYVTKNRATDNNNSINNLTPNKSDEEFTFENGRQDHKEMGMSTTSSYNTSSFGTNGRSEGSQMSMNNEQDVSITLNYMVYYNHVIQLFARKCFIFIRS